MLKKWCLLIFVLCLVPIVFSSSLSSIEGTEIPEYASFFFGDQRIQIHVSGLEETLIGIVTVNGTIESAFFGNIAAPTIHIYAHRDDVINAFQSSDPINYILRLINNGDIVVKPIGLVNRMKFLFFKVALNRYLASLSDIRTTPTLEAHDVVNRSGGIPLDELLDITTLEVPPAATAQVPVNEENESRVASLLDEYLNPTETSSTSSSNVSARVLDAINNHETTEEPAEVETSSTSSSEPAEEPTEVESLPFFEFESSTNKLMIINDLEDNSALGLARQNLIVSVAIASGVNPLVDYPEYEVLESRNEVYTNSESFYNIIDSNERITDVDPGSLSSAGTGFRTFPINFIESPDGLIHYTVVIRYGYWQPISVFESADHWGRQFTLIDDCSGRVIVEYLNLDISQDPGTTFVIKASNYLPSGELSGSGFC